MEKNKDKKKEEGIADSIFGALGDAIGTVTHLPIGHHDEEEERVYKIKYSLNVLPSMNDFCKDDLMEAIIRTDENDVFISEAVMDMVDFKWQKYAFKRHMIGAFFHIIYLSCLLAYISHTFLVVPTHDAMGVIQMPNCSIKYMYVLFGCLIYPTMYDGTQCVKQGGDYFRDGWNYLDMTHIGLGYANIYCQYSVGTWALSSKIVLLAIICIGLLKTFFFMRIVKKFSYIVTMINRVFVDLLVFLLFFVIQVTMFAQLFNVISPPAVHAEDTEGLRNNEYRHIGMWMGNLLTVLRLSLGDFSFDVL